MKNLNIYFASPIKLLVKGLKIALRNKKVLISTNISGDMKLRGFAAAFLLLLNSCNNTTEPVETDDGEYMSFHVGDIRQYSMQYASGEPSYTLWKVTGKTLRADSTEVFITEWYFYSLDPDNKDVTYGFIRDGYYYGTNLDSLDGLPGNPYYEQRVAKIKPKDGDTWAKVDGFFYYDSVTDRISAKYLPELNTTAGKFKDVYNFIHSMGMPGSSLVQVYYAKDFGHLGYSIMGDTTSMFSVNYIKVNGKEMGTYHDMPGKSNKNYKEKNDLINGCRRAFNLNRR